VSLRRDITDTGTIEKPRHLSMKVKDDLRRNMTTAPPSPPDAVARVFDGYPPKIRRKLLAIRKLVFKTAAATQGVGELQETLKWGEPAYITSKTNSGSTIRLAWKRATPTEFAVYFNCQTSLVDTFRTLFPSGLRFEGNRAIVFSESDAVNNTILSVCITVALTYT
jgi:hypothetical protein